MGIRNVNAAFVYWSHLPDRPFRVLVRMCAIANDDTRHYYGGQELLAEGLGLTFPPLPGADADLTDDEQAAIHKARDEAFRRVRRALQVLTDAGVVKVKVKAKSARRAEYIVHPGTPPEQVTERPAEQVRNRPTEQVNKRPGAGQKVTASVGQKVTPQPLPTTSSPEQDQGISPTTQVSPPASEQHEPDDAQPEMDQFEAQAILNDADKRGVNVVALMKSAPADCTTKGQRRIWAARQIIAEEAS